MSIYIFKMSVDYRIKLEYYLGTCTCANYNY